MVFSDTHSTPFDISKAINLAIVAAVEDAIGIRFHEIPLTPVRVLNEINKVYFR